MSDVRENEFGDKPKEERVNGMPVDRLSALPDDILIRILSRLGFNSNVKDAVVTCVLSKRWNFLWSQMPMLNFCNCKGDPEKTGDFVSRVHRIIILHSSSYIDQFSVQFLYDECYALDVTAWIRFALKKKVKDLSVRLHSQSYFYSPPLLLYSGASLTRLSLKMCNLAPPRKIDWPHLTCLRLQYVELPQEVMEKILSGCPVLCDLCLMSCWGYNNINSESLWELTVTDHSDTNDVVVLLEISTPYLRSLSISFSPLEKKLQLTNLPSSLDCVNIFYYEMDDSVEVLNNTMELLEKTRHAKLLVLIGGPITEVVSEMVTRGWQLPQSTRLQLTLTLTVQTWSKTIITGILCLLESSPNLKKLLIEYIDPYEESKALWDPSPRNDLDCDLLNLKTVCLHHIALPNFDGEPMLTMARILLKRATMLEKMVIELEDIHGVSPDLTKLSETVLGYPRSSEKAVIVFQKFADEDP